MDNQHKFMFDVENLINILILNGFPDAKHRDFNNDIDPIMRKHESIYAIATKQ